MSRRMRWFIAGLGLGAGAGFLAAAMGTLGLVLLVVAALWASLVPPRFALLAGLLTASGAVWLLVTLRFAALCNDQPGTCAGPAIGPFLLIAAVVTAVGLGAAAVTAWMARHTVR
jgi:hypothetical protein